MSKPIVIIGHIGHGIADLTTAIRNTMDVEIITPQEAEAMYGRIPEPKPMKIEAPPILSLNAWKPPLTRRERRKAKRKK